ncbi:hypothetical protein U8335_02250 [Roseiconus lacunae]|uniref:hypothetical protein n=1 Tax=Roseiconus lacunae TaxID=2605694 RepID=UPI00308AF77F|nr:hypothetical protein U8335_02250 [Stieleria sp. HD01]
MPSILSVVAGKSLGGLCAVAYKRGYAKWHTLKDLHAMLVKHRPSKPTGAAAHKKNRQEVRQPKELPSAPSPGTRAYIEQRLQRDHPEVFDARSSRKSLTT